MDAMESLDCSAASAQANLIEKMCNSTRQTQMMIKYQTDTITKMMKRINKLEEHCKPDSDIRSPLIHAPIAEHVYVELGPVKSPENSCKRLKNQENSNDEVLKGQPVGGEHVYDELRPITDQEKASREPEIVENNLEGEFEVLDEELNQEIEDYGLCYKLTESINSPLDSLSLAEMFPQVSKDVGPEKHLTEKEHHDLNQFEYEPDFSSEIHELEDSIVNSNSIQDDVLISPERNENISEIPDSNEIFPLENCNQGDHNIQGIPERNKIIQNENSDQDDQTEKKEVGNSDQVEHSKSNFQNEFTRSISINTDRFVEEMLFKSNPNHPVLKVKSNPVVNEEPQIIFDVQVIKREAEERKRKALEQAELRKMGIRKRMGLAN